jgi:hypothetical protein
MVCENLIVEDTLDLLVHFMNFEIESIEVPAFDVSGVEEISELLLGAFNYPECTIHHMDVLVFQFQNVLYVQSALLHIPCQFYE